MPPIDPPEEPTGLKPLQLPSGVGVLPVRTLSATPVPAGVSAVHERASQLTDWPASRTRESNVPEVGVGAQMEPIDRDVGAAAVEVARQGSHLGVPKSTAWVATRLPSTKYRTSVESHSIR